MNGLSGKHENRRGISLSPNRSSIVSVLDIGSSKICCMVAKLKPSPRKADLPGRSHQIELIGIGHQLSQGVKGGVITDMDAAEQAIRSAVDAAERMAGITIEGVIVNMSCGRIASNALSATVAIGGQEVDDRDIQRVLHAGRSHSGGDGRSVVHAVPIGYSLDGVRGVQDPRGMLGRDLGVDINVVTAETAPMRNLSLCVSRCHLVVDAIVTTPYASGLSSMVRDETDLGVLCLDMGGGTTSASIFYENNFVHADVITIGGRHVTLDIARGLSTPLAAAERIKTLYGSALASESDERETITVPPVGGEVGEAGNVIPRSMLTGIIQPRLEEIFELVRDRLKSSGFEQFAARRVVLTGGASLLPGARELATRILDKQTRIGRPLGVAGLPEAVRGPAFAAATGMLVYPQVAGREMTEDLPDIQGGLLGNSYLAKVSGWLRDSF
jgi:cell division protein FtsA